MPILRNTRVILAPSGRYAIMARYDDKGPWVQIESVLGRDRADEYAEKMDGDDEERSMTIREAIDDEQDWGRDAPTGEVT